MDGVEMSMAVEIFARGASKVPTRSRDILVVECGATKVPSY
jgi:hypothetical protein